MTDVTRKPLESWIGKQEVTLDYVTIPFANRIAAMLDRDDISFKLGDPLPTGWHNLLFPRIARQSELDIDGHPKRGDFLPAVPLPRRVFGGRRAKIHAPLFVGDTVTGVAEIVAIANKQARSGTLVIVTVRTSMSTDRGLAIVQEQDIIYREEPGNEAPASPPIFADEPASHHKLIDPDPVLMFRFSALGFNGHRIHYDHPYVTQKERYRGLVVSGGLTLLLLNELVGDVTDRAVSAFNSRNLRMLFGGEPIKLCAGAVKGDRLALWAEGPDGAVAIRAEAELVSAA